MHPCTLPNFHEADKKVAIIVDCIAWLAIMHARDLYMESCIIIKE
jgi:hypothetical protein